MSLLDAIYLVTFLIEVGVLLYLEYKTWNTLYTPLNFLMLPYTAVLIVTVLLAGSSWGFVDFYYPSIFIWNVGLLLFAIPSFTLGAVLQYNHISLRQRPLDDHFPKMLLLLSFLLAAMFMWHLKGMLTSSAEALGSDEFGDEFSGGGLWGHLRQLTIPLLMMSIYYVSKQRWWLWPVIGVFLIVGMLNQVKGWVIIPVLAAMAIRLYTGKTKLTMKLIGYVVLGAFVVFFLSYALSILVVQNRGVSGEFMEFIFGHFFHYLTSGTFGWSMDLERGLPDDGGSFQNVIAQLVNLCKSLTGDKELVYPVNPLYYNSGLTLTNVRTFFGTIYINASAAEFTLYVLFISLMMYLMRLAMLHFNNVHIYVIYFFYCGLLFMGWFDLYFASLTILEFPILVLMLWLMERMLQGKPEISK